MPIRINLLAEQQAAEEARRRDPVKRALWLASGSVLLMLLWIGSLQLKLVSARANLGGYEAKLLKVEENSKEARANWGAAADLESRIANLERYTTNRFFSATLLNALQQVVSEEVRVMQLQTLHTYSTNAESTFRTNLVFPVQTRKAWQFWKSGPPAANIPSLVSNQIAGITSKVEALKSPVELITRIDLSTNKGQATAKIEITRPAVATEQILLTIKARDYSPGGKRVDEFSKALANHPYFAERLLQREGEGVRLRERGIQPEFDPGDPLSPTRPYVPFVIECRYRETARANE